MIVIRLPGCTTPFCTLHTLIYTYNVYRRRSVLASSAKSDCLVPSTYAKLDSDSFESIAVIPKCIAMPKG
jgi:hypothetical protein